MVQSPDFFPRKLSNTSSELSQGSVSDAVIVLSVFSVCLYSVLFFSLVFGCKTPSYLPEGRPGMSDVTLLSGISGLSFDSPFLSPLLFFLPSPFALSVLSFFC